jgi:hypothetical protein
MAKWMKAINGQYYNVNDIKTIEWKKNTSAVGASFELKCENSRGTYVLATCENETDKQMITDKLETFMKNEDEDLIIFPKL